MQNVVTKETEDGKSHDVTLFTEYLDASKFIIREMLGTKNKGMVFQAGVFVTRPMRIPVFKEIFDQEAGEPRVVLTHHRGGDDIQVFHLHGIGRTKEEALTRASNKLLRAEIAVGTR